MANRFLPWLTRARLIRATSASLLALAIMAAGAASPPAEPEPSGEVPPARVGDAPASPTPAEPAAGDVGRMPEELEDLLAALDAASFTERRQAQEALIAYLLVNPQAATHVEEAARSHPSLEVRSRCEAVLGQFAQERAFGATRVSVDIRDATLARFVEQLEAATGVRFRIWPEHILNDGATGRFSFTVEDVPFWRMLAELERQTELSWMEHHQAAGEATAISLMVGQGHGNANWSRLPTVYEGAFAVQLGRMWRHENLSILPLVDDDGRIVPQVQSHGSLQMELRLLTEPKIRRAGMVRGPILEELVDEEGRDLSVRTAQGQQHFRGGTGLVVQTGVQLDAKAWERARQIALIRGRFEVEVATQTEQVTWTLADVLGREGQEGDGAGQPAEEEPGEAEEGGGEADDPDEALDEPAAEGPGWAERVAQRVVQDARAAVRVERGEIEVDRARVRQEQLQIQPGRRVGGGHGALLSDELFGGLRVGERVEVNRAVTLGDHAVRLVSISRDERQLMLEIEMEGPGAAAAMQDWQSQQQLIGGLQLLDADGKAWDSGGGATHFDDRRLKFTRTFVNTRGDAGPADRFVWDVSTRTSTVRVPFEFRDIPLPQRD